MAALNSARFSNMKIKELQDEANRRFGNLLKETRQNAGMSQEDLAFSAGIDQSTLSKVERSGPQAISWGKLLSLAEALGCTVEITLRTASKD